jgi:hypothetical protein
MKKNVEIRCGKTLVERKNETVKKRSQNGKVKQRVIPKQRERKKKINRKEAEKVGIHKKKVNILLALNHFKSTLRKVRGTNVNSKKLSYITLIRCKE